MRVNIFTCIFVLFQRASLAEQEMNTLKEQLLATSPGPSATSTPSTSPVLLNNTCAKTNEESNDVEQVLTAPPSPSNENNNLSSNTDETNNLKKHDTEFESNASTSIDDKNHRLKDSNVIADLNEEANIIEAKDKEVCTVKIKKKSICSKLKS